MKIAIIEARFINYLIYMHLQICLCLPSSTGWKNTLEIISRIFPVVFTILLFLSLLLLLLLKSLYYYYVNYIKCQLNNAFLKTINSKLIIVIS